MSGVSESVRYAHIALDIKRAHRSCFRAIARGYQDTCSYVITRHLRQLRRTKFQTIPSRTTELI